MANAEEKKWWDEGNDEESSEEDIPFEYDVTSSPNDFNVHTLCSFLEVGIISLPAFQRHYVWDKKRASKFIESLLIGLPVPQIFLYEQEKNKFLIIDGQQRYFTIYFFLKKALP
jgi:uncharacterized protein with ParB-like and HNH nuclease domain